MNIYKQNIHSITEYLKKGCKDTNQGAVGVEIEHFVCNKNGECMPYRNGVEYIMEKIAPHFKKHIYSEGFLIGLSCDDYHITLEPGAQIEISIMPSSDLAKIEGIYNNFLSIVNPVLEEKGYRLVCTGYLPIQKAEQISLIPKKRYEFMDMYFKSTGICGKNMMRGTASTQVSIDFTNEDDCIKKLKYANILSPILALICDNSPIFEGKPFIANTLRSYIWNNVDNERCGIVDCNSFEEYAEYIYNSPAILISKNNDFSFTGSKKICDIYNDTILTEPEIEHLLSMFFPDVRLKQYLEIRPADSMPIKYVLAYSALIKGLFKNSNQIFNNISTEQIEDAKKQIILHGFYGDVYGIKAYKAAELIYETSYNNLSEKDRTYLSVLKEIIYGKKTLKETISFAEGRGIL